MTSNTGARRKIKLKKADVDNNASSPQDLKVRNNSISIKRNSDRAPLKLKRSSVTRGGSKGRKKSGSTIYGLDVNFLKEIGKDDVVQEYEKRLKEDQETEYYKKSGTILSLEQKFKRPKKLREI